MYACLDIYMLEGAFGSYKWSSDILGLEWQAVERHLTQGRLEKRQMFFTAELFSSLTRFLF